MEERGTRRLRLPLYFFMKDMCIYDEELDGALRIIDELLESREAYHEPTTFKMRRIKFETMAYANWALKELKIFLISYIDCTPLEAIDIYIQKMLDYAAYVGTNKDSDLNYIFSVAADVGTDVKDCLLICRR
jgi:hypothetical protein